MEVPLANKIETKIKFKLTNLQKFLKISKVFHANTLDINLLNEFDYQQLNSKDILEIFIFKKFNVEAISNVEDFLSKTKDIYDALQYSKEEFLFNLFQIFFKYQKEKLYIDILNLLNYEYFEKCLLYIKKEKPKIFQELISENNIFCLRIMENTKNFNLLNQQLSSFTYNKKPSIKFAKENQDLVTLLNTNLSELKKEDFSSEFETEGKTNFFCFLTKINEEGFKISSNSDQQGFFNGESPEVQKKYFKYSLHPKLVELLDRINFNYQGKEFHFNTKIYFKCNLYKLLLGKKLAVIENILDWENIQYDLSTIINQEEMFNLLKIILNVYDINFEKFQIFDQFFKNLEKKLLLFLEEQKRKIFIDLLIFNLNNIKHVNTHNFEFLRKVFKNCVSINLEDDLKMLGFLNRITNDKFNVIPFIANLRSLFEQFPILQDACKNYYNEYIQNLYYFNKQSLRFGNEHIYKEIEVFKNINLNNFANFNKIFQICWKEQEINSNFLFSLNLCVSYFNISSAINPTAEIQREIIHLLRQLISNNQQVIMICSEVCHLVNLSFILEAQKSILLLDRKLSFLVRDYLNSKVLFSQFLLEAFPLYIENSALILTNFKILRIKQYIINTLNEQEIKPTYERVQHLTHLDEFEPIFHNNERMKNDIIKIYTS
jgi:hypothetical protein